MRQGSWCGCVNYDLLAQKLSGQTFDTPVFIQHVLDVASLNASSLVLDLGCGSGYIARAICQSSGAMVIGLDKSLPMLNIASRHVQVIAGDAERIPVRPNSFDCVVAAFLVHVLRDLRKVIEEAFKVLRGGPLIILTASEKDLERRYSNRYFPSLLRIDRRRYPPISVLHRILVKTGFSNIAVNSLLLDWVHLNDSYVVKHHQKRWSSLVLLPDDEFQMGIEQMRREIAEQGNEGIPVIPWIRTVITAWKG
jgi:ubiquinone/menaquinone biosynthesis C-methylase UbiE